MEFETWWDFLKEFGKPDCYNIPIEYIEVDGKGWLKICQPRKNRVLEITVNDISMQSNMEIGRYWRVDIIDLLEEKFKLNEPRTEAVKGE